MHKWPTLHKMLKIIKKPTEENLLEIIMMTVYENPQNKGEFWTNI